MLEGSAEKDARGSRHSEQWTLKIRIAGVGRAGSGYTLAPSGIAFLGQPNAGRTVCRGCEDAYVPSQNLMGLATPRDVPRRQRQRYTVPYCYITYTETLGEVLQLFYPYFSFT